MVYLAAVTYFGIRIAGRQTSTDDYFLGSRNLPWWVVCFSIVATETSTLTIIGLPAVAYGGTLTFLQLTIGYLLGRTIVSLVLLPRYYERRLVTTYEFLGLRYGDVMRATASMTFLITRLLADGVRLFATAIPLKIIAMSAGFDVSYFEIILVLGMITVFYTLIGGIRAVVWMDVLQMTVYLFGAFLAVVLLIAHISADWWSDALRAGKTMVFDLGLDQSLSGVLTQAYILPTAVLGGAVFSVASHGTDQLIVQRLLACRSLRDSQRALIGKCDRSDDPVCSLPPDWSVALELLQRRNDVRARIVTCGRSLSEVYRRRPAGWGIGVTACGYHCCGDEYAFIHCQFPGVVIIYGYLPAFRQNDAR